MVYESIVAFTSKIYCFSSFVKNSQGFPNPLSPEEENELIKKAKQGDKEARDKVITHNLRLVAHIVKNYTRTLEADDLISVGTIGLIKAVDSYEFDKGVKLSTYAARCINNEILMLLRSNKKYKGVLSLNSICPNTKNDSEVELEDLIQSDEEYDVFNQVEKSCMYDKAVETIDKSLNPIEKQIILKRFGVKGNDTLTQREVAKELGISRSYVSRIETKALKTIRKNMDPDNDLN